MGADKYKGKTGMTEPMTVTKIEPRTDLMEPHLYKVIFLNDDKTSMEFVVGVLMAVFGKSEDEAHAIMLEVHEEGAAVVAVMPFEIAETKVATVLAMAIKNGFPLVVNVEADV
jgi:ATP-dependent Clp protease adaptor protein ClpS